MSLGHQSIHLNLFSDAHPGPDTGDSAMNKASMVLVFVEITVGGKGNLLHNNYRYDVCYERGGIARYTGEA